MQHLATAAAVVAADNLALLLSPPFSVAFMAVGSPEGWEGNGFLRIAGHKVRRGEGEKHQDTGIDRSDVSSFLLCLLHVEKVFVVSCPPEEVRSDCCRIVDTCGWVGWGWVADIHCVQVAFDFS